MGRKYTDFEIFNEVYCNSLGAHSFFGFCSAGRFEWQEGTVLMPGKRDWLFVEWPQYAHAAVEALIADKLARGEFRVYECDRDGNKRYDDLRYHDATYFMERYGNVPSPVDPTDPPGHVGFYAEADGDAFHVLGDPAMSEETMEALRNVVRAARAAVERGDFDEERGE